MDTTASLVNDETLVYKKAFELLSRNTKEYQDFVKFIETMVIPTLPTHHHLLDVGAGRGNLTKPISAYFRQATIVEPNPLFYSDLMAWAQVHRVDLVGHNAHWQDVVLDLTADLIIISHVLYYVPLEYHHSFINKAYAHLRPGGSMIVALNGEQSDIWKLSQQLFAPHDFAKLAYAERLYHSLREWHYPAVFHHFHSAIDTDTEEDMRFLIDFLMLGKVAFDNDHHVHIRETYLKTHLQKSDRYSITSSGGIIVVTKPMEQ